MSIFTVLIFLNFICYTSFFLTLQRYEFNFIAQ
nr:MAG TPA: hypothetical protein [Caudoviricetes sp.]